MSPLANRVITLKKQLTMETKVKQGAENIIQTYASSSVKVWDLTHTACCSIKQAFYLSSQI